MTVDELAFVFIALPAVSVLNAVVALKLWNWLNVDVCKVLTAVVSAFKPIALPAVRALKVDAALKLSIELFTEVNTELTVDELAFKLIKLKEVRVVNSNVALKLIIVCTVDRARTLVKVRTSVILDLRSKPAAAVKDILLISLLIAPLNLWK